ncbi:MAG: aldo/keto reductase [Spirochaetia bacterium]
MEKRQLGETDMELSIMGYGGFHLVEIDSGEAASLLNTYLDHGGNYIETAPSYGEGFSETKIGRAVSHRRDEYYLATKCHIRDADGAAVLLDESLKRLKTDYVDVLFVHALQTEDELDQVIGSNGALRAIEKAKVDGKVRYVAVSSHGRPRTLFKALKEYPFDLFMTGINYYDYCNYPELYTDVLPWAKQNGIGVLGMKSLADGFLYQSFIEGIRFALSQPIVSLVLGVNNREQLEKDLALMEEFHEVDQNYIDELLKKAPELGTYVCRQCGECKTAEFDPSKIFALEGVFDRQMDDHKVGDTARYALRERLKHWFAQQDEPVSEYSQLSKRVDPYADYSNFNRLCPYNIDIDRKLKIAHEKLGDDGFIY